MRSSPLLKWWGVSLALAGLSAVIWPTVPSYDPFSWVVWGREVTDPHISFFVGGGPSWKPLPFVFTSVYGAFGSAAPTLWVITSRIGAIAGLIAAFRIAVTLSERASVPRLAAWAGGVFAAVGLALTVDWTYYFFRGASEPLLAGVILWAVDRLIAGRLLQAYALLAAEGLMRPEAWPFLLLFGAWLFWREPAVRTRVLVVLGLVAQPVGWFVPPWISTGEPFLAASHASSYNGHLGSNPFATVVGRGEGLQPLPSLLLGAAAVLLAAWYGREALRAVWQRRPGLRELVAGSFLAELPAEVPLAAIVLAWWVVVVGMTLDGYPGLERFFLPAAAITCALSGVGFARIACLAGRATPVPLPAAIAAGAVIAALSVHFVSGRISFARAQEPLAARAVTRIDQLGQAVAALGGRRRILPCGSSVVTVNHSLQSALAWKLGTTLERVQTALHKGSLGGLAFVGPHDSIDGGYPPISGTLSTHTLIKTVGVWRIYQVYAPGVRPRCVGS